MWIEERPFYLQCLLGHLDERKQRNPRYSLRAFAVWLSIHPSSLSRILAGKQEMSTKSCALAIRKLDLDEETREKFVRSFVDHKATQIEAVLSRRNRQPTERNGSGSL